MQTKTNNSGQAAPTTGQIARKKGPKVTPGSGMHSQSNSFNANNIMQTDRKDFLNASQRADMSRAAQGQIPVIHNS